MALAERAWYLTVPHHARGARVARHRLAAELSEVLDASVLADVLTIVTEMVGNAVTHADPLPGGVVRVAWRLRPGPESETVEVRVTDGGATKEPNVKVVDPDATAGRGLTIVAALADRWGVHRDGLGQSVWAELSAATTPPAAPSPALPAPSVPSAAAPATAATATAAAPAIAPAPAAAPSPAGPHADQGLVPSV